MPRKNDNRIKCKWCGVPYAEKVNGSLAFGVCSTACQKKLKQLWAHLPPGERPALPPPIRPRVSQQSNRSKFPRVQAQDRAQFLNRGAGLNERCAICGDLPSTKRHSLDHCHVSGRMRGVLCTRCNSGLGFFRDDPRILKQAIEYLRRADHYYDGGEATATLPHRLSRAAAG